VLVVIRKGHLPTKNQKRYCVGIIFTSDSRTICHTWRFRHGYLWSCTSIAHTSLWRGAERSTGWSQPAFYNSKNKHNVSSQPKWADLWRIHSCQHNDVWWLAKQVAAFHAPKNSSAPARKKHFFSREFRLRMQTSKKSSARNTTAPNVTVFK